MLIYLIKAYQTVFPNHRFYGPAPRSDIDEVLAEPWFYLHDGNSPYELGEMIGQFGHGLRNPIFQKNRIYWAPINPFSPKRSCTNGDVQDKSWTPDSLDVQDKSWTPDSGLRT